MSSETGFAPVFLVGAARSGTSLLFRTMALHPDATWLSNWVQRFPAAPQLTALNAVCRALPERRARVWFGADGDNAYVYGAQRTWRDRLLPQPVEAESLYRRAGVPELGAEPGEPVPEEAVEQLRQCLRTASRWDRRQVHVAKRIANNRRIPLLLHAFSDARFVEIVRDGRAVAVSLSKVDWWAESDVWWYGGNPQSWREDGGDEWSLCARNWVEEVRAVRQGLQQVAPDRVLSLTYEELVADPHGTLERVVGFSGLDPESSAFRRALARVRFPDKNDRWRTHLDPAALATVEQIQRSELVHYGYGLSTVPRAVPSRDAS
jgi:hypothetical protein